MDDFKITLSTSHMINLGNDSYIEARHAKVGINSLMTVNGLSAITSVQIKRLSLHYSPYTYSGKIMINGCCRGLACAY